MRIRLGSGFLLLNLLVVVLIVAILLIPSSAVRIVLGLPFMLFFPGYVLILALFPRKEGMDGIERVALSFGLSIAVVLPIGLILNFTPWGIGLEPVLYSLASFIFVMSLIAWLRRRWLPEGERFELDFRLGVPGWGGGTWDKVLSVVLAVAILGVLGTLGYVIAAPKMEERFTEFYILGTEGKAADYARELEVGEEAAVTIGIVNHEYGTVSYRVEISVEGVRNDEVGPVVLENEQMWEGTVSFAPDKAGGNQKVEFILYKNSETEPCLEPLHLWVNVTE